MEEERELSEDDDVEEEDDDGRVIGEEVEAEAVEGREEEGREDEGREDEGREEEEASAAAALAVCFLALVDLRTGLSSFLDFLVGTGEVVVTWSLNLRFSEAWWGDGLKWRRVAVAEVPRSMCLCLFAVSGSLLGDETFLRGERGSEGRKKKGRYGNGEKKLERQG